MKTFSGIFSCAVTALFLAVNTAAQPVTFMKMYNKGNCGYAVREVNGNSYITAGSTDYYYNYHWHMLSGIGTTNVHLFKTNDNGTLLWEKIYNRLNYRMLATWAEPCSDGGFILTGHTNQDMIWPPDSNDVLLIKTDGTGTISWAKIFNSGKDELGFCVRPTADGGFIVSGFHDAVPTSLAGNTYALLIKTDGSGNIEWSKKYQIAVRDFDTGEAFPCVAKQTIDGGYIVTGTTMGSHQADVYLFRTDGSGNLLWAKSYEHDGSAFRLSTGQDIIESNSGDFIIAGSMDKDRSLSQFNYPYILKASSTGVIQSTKLFDSNPAQMFQSGFSSVQQTSDGGFFFTGMGGYGGFGDQAQLLKMNVAFVVQWSRSYTNDGMATMGSRSGRYTTDGGYVFTGKKNFSGTVLLKTNSVGLVNCKNPSSLIELTPSVISVIRTPSVISGIGVSNILLVAQAFLIDTATVCPVAITPLPVDLKYFNAEPRAKKVVLSWETVSEINNNYFAIEKSTDGKNFMEAGRINGAGNSAEALNYSFTDNQPLSFLISYYRLKQVDYDGKINYSRTVPVIFSSDEFNLLNLKCDRDTRLFTVYVSNNEVTTIELSIMDLTGRIIYSNSKSATKGIEEMTVDMKNSVNGIYFVTLNNGDKIIAAKFIY